MKWYRARPKREGLKSWVSARILRRKPKIKIPILLWQELWHLNQYAESEYSALLQVEEVTPDLYYLRSWYLPFQEASQLGVELTRTGAITMVREVADPGLFNGVYHIHPGRRHIPQMSAIDVQCMWNWIRNAEKGIFIVSDRSGIASAILVHRVDGVPIQVEMDVEVDWSLPLQRAEALQHMIQTRVSIRLEEEEWWKKPVLIYQRERKPEVDAPNATSGIPEVIPEGMPQDKPEDKSEAKPGREDEGKADRKA